MGPPAPWCSGRMSTARRRATWRSYGSSVPSGAVLAQRRARVERTQAQRLVYIGKRRPAGEWLTGDYRGEYVLYRGERSERVVELERAARLR